MKLNILFLPSDKGGVYQYRVEAVSKWLTKLDLARTRILYQENFGVLDLLWADIIVCQRKHDRDEFEGVLVQSREVIAQLNAGDVSRQINKLFVFDTDDLLEKVAQSNPAYRIYYPGSDAIAMYRAWIQESDALTTSTRKLGQEYMFLNQRVFVNPNFVDTEIWETLIDVTPPPEDEGKIRIGFAGSSTHHDDLAMVKGDLKALMNAYPNVLLTIFGVPALSKGQKMSTFDLRHLLNDLPQDRITYVEGVETRNYPTRLKSLGIHIGICPLVDNQFNQSKSAIKYYEYAMAGAAVIASDVGEYPEVITPQTGLLTKRNDWYKNLKKLVDSTPLRLQLSDGAHRDVMENHTASKVVQTWYDNYLKMWSKPVDNHSPTEKT